METKLITQIVAVVLVITVGVIGPVVWRLAYWRTIKLDMPEQAIDPYAGDVQSYGRHPFNPSNAVFWMGLFPVLVDAFVVWRHPELKSHSVFRKLAD